VNRVGGSKVSTEGRPVGKLNSRENSRAHKLDLGRGQIKLRKDWDPQGTIRGGTKHNDLPRTGFSAEGEAWAKNWPTPRTPPLEAGESLE